VWEILRNPKFRQGVGHAEAHQQASIPTGPAAALGTKHTWIGSIWPSQGKNGAIA